MRKQLVVLIALCVALNLGLGTIIFMLKLPIYLDMVGTILCALILWREPFLAFMAASVAGVVSFLLGGIINPFLPWFSGTVVAVAGITSFVTNRGAEYLSKGSLQSPRFWLLTVGFGILTGLVAAVVSAPIVVYLFGGVTGSGSAVLVAFFLKLGKQLMNAALLSGLTAEPVDKTLQLLLAVLLLHATPASFLSRFQHTKSQSGSRGADV